MVRYYFPVSELSVAFISKYEYNAYAFMVRSQNQTGEVHKPSAELKNLDRGGSEILNTESQLKFLDAFDTSLEVIHKLCYA